MPPALIGGRGAPRRYAGYDCRQHGNGGEHQVHGPSRNTAASPGNHSCDQRPGEGARHGIQLYNVVRSIRGARLARAAPRPMCRFAPPGAYLRGEEASDDGCPIGGLLVNLVHSRHVAQAIAAAARGLPVAGPICEPSRSSYCNHHKPHRGPGRRSRPASGTDVSTGLST